eukprot:scaffold69727_cov21-Tisochrysis_lutea.AAC.1
MVGVSCSEVCSRCERGWGRWVQVQTEGAEFADQGYRDGWKKVPVECVNVEWRKFQWGACMMGGGSGNGVGGASSTCKGVCDGLCEMRWNEQHV